jgi:hypothetical protein
MHVLVVKLLCEATQEQIPVLESLLPGARGHCHTLFLYQNQVLIVCMTQDQLFHTYGQKCS